MSDPKKKKQYVRVLPTNLSGLTSLVANLGAESIDFFDNELFHPFNTVLFLETEIKFLTRLINVNVFANEYKHSHQGRLARQPGHAKPEGKDDSKLGRNSSAWQDQSRAFERGDRLQEDLRGDTTLRMGLEA
jgi:hypothetical protein